MSASDHATRLDITALFEGKRLFVLGGTGFLGKVFVSMLLDRFPNVERLYLLVRGKKGQSSEARFFDEIVRSPAFDPVRTAHGEAWLSWLREKIVPVDGDIGRPLCGVEHQVLEDSSGTLHAVVNVAGLVDFNPPLDEALHANAFGAQNLVALAQALGGAPLFHTSTCYVAGRRRGPIKETDPTLYPFPRADEIGRELWDPDREIEECLELIAEARHRADDAFRQSELQERAKKSLIARGEPTEGPAFDKELSKIKRKLVAERLVTAGVDRATHWGWPNIYTYTKSIGEQVVARSGLPFTIVRPACCETTKVFPFPGWNEGITTSAPLIYLMLKGQVQIPALHVPLDFIPTDLVTAGMLLSLAELLEGTHKPVYHYGASDLNPCTAARLGELCGLYKRKLYQRKGTGNPLLNMLQAHVEPVFVSAERFDRMGPPAIAAASKTVAKLLKKSAPFLAPAAHALEGMAKREEKIGEIGRLFAPFTTMENGPFDCANTRAAFERLSEEDRPRLLWDPEDLNFARWMTDIHLPAIEKLIVPEMDAKLRRELAPLASHATLVTLARQMAERHEHTVALQRLEAEGFSRVTYRDVWKRSGAAAARLASLGVEKGDRVALSGANHPDWAIAYFGILRASATVVPLDPALDQVALTNVLQESGAKLLVLGDNALEETQASIPVVRADALTEENDALVPPEGEPAADDVASLLYTSGTTGTPKGVKLTHANFTALIASLAPLFPLRRGDRVLSVLPLHHTFEFTCGLLLPFSRGARVAYLDELNAEKLARGLKEGRVAAMVGVPALWQMLERRILSEVKSRGPLAAAAFEWGAEINRALGKRTGLDFGRLLFGSVHAELGGNVRYLISGGAALPKDTHQFFAGLGLHLTEGYGLTEAAPVLTVAKASPKGKAGQVGKPVPGVEIRVVGADDQGVGEIHARGGNVMAGYTDDVETREVLGADGWLKTGDSGKLDKQGRLTVVGRSKDVVVTASGENLYPDDVEHRLGTVPHVEELALVGIPAPGGGERLACLAVPKENGEEEREARLAAANDALRTAFEKLPFGQRPAIVHLYDAKLPRTATKKVRRDEVRVIVARLAAARQRASGDGDASSVRAAIATLRGVPEATLSATTSLQGDLGFDSLMLTELLETLESSGGGALDPAALKACVTVADVEALAGARRTASRTKTIAGNEAKEITLPPAVQEVGRKVIGKLQDAFYDRVMTSRVTGRAFIPHNRNTIVVANHASHLDMGLVRHALGAYGEEIVSLAAQDYFFEGGIRKAFFENLTNLVAFDRGSNLRQALRQAGEVIARGKTVLIFPEGTRSTSGSVQEFKPLVGHLALAHGVDILPVFLGGTHAAMPKGQPVPLKRELTARIGPPLAMSDLRRLTEGLTPADAAREVARLAHAAVLALSTGEVVDLKRAKKDEPVLAEREHPLVTLFAELEGKFLKGGVEKPVSYYFTLGQDDMAKWTVRVDPSTCDVKPGKPEGGTADCVLKTSPEIFTKIVRESYVPGPADFMSGAIKSNDVSLLMTFQRVFQLDQVSS